MFMPLDKAFKSTPLTGWPRFELRAWLDNEVVVVVGFPTLPGAGIPVLAMMVVGDAAVGWLMNMTLEHGTGVVGEVSFVTEMDEEEGENRINFVTWDFSSG